MFSSKKRREALFAFLAWTIAAASSPPAQAQSDSFNGTVALSSQLVDRGLALSPVTPILQGAASWTSSGGWALGLSAATEVRSPGRGSEALAQAARYWPLSDDWRMQADLTYYTYPGNSGASPFDRVETGVNWMYRDVLTFGLSAITLTHGSDQQPRGAADVDFHWPLPRHFSLSAGLGVTQSLLASDRFRGFSGPGPYGHDSYAYRHAHAGAYYGYGQLGLVWIYGPWRVELDRMFTDPDVRRSGAAASPWVGTIAWSF